MYIIHICASKPNIRDFVSLFTHYLEQSTIFLIYRNLVNNILTAHMLIKEIFEGLEESVILSNRFQSKMSLHFKYYEKQSLEFR